MASNPLTADQITLVTDRFRVLGEPARLHILQAMRTGERTVSELVEITGFGTANVSKHLHLLHASGFLTRRKAGLFVYYGLASKDVFKLCDIVCGGLEVEVEARRRMVAGR